MTLAPLANAMQAYHQQMLNIHQQQQQQPQLSAANVQAAAAAAAAAAASASAGEEDSESGKCRVLCVSPDEEMGFLLNLPPPCNVILQPSNIGMSGKVPNSQFLMAYERFLKGELTQPSSLILLQMSFLQAK